MHWAWPSERVSLHGSVDPHWRKLGAGIVRQAGNAGAVGVHHVNFLKPESVGHENNPAAVG